MRLYVVVLLFAIAPLVCQAAITYDSISSLKQAFVGCPANASWEIAESIPSGMKMPWTTPQSTYQAWTTLLTRAQSTIDIAAMYFTLSNGPDSLGGWEGAAILSQLVAAAQRGVKIRIVQQMPSYTFPDNDSLWLASKGYAQVYNIDWVKIVGNGILHTKMILIDGAHLYLGSANMDWASLTQVKELGIVVQDCPYIVQDVSHIFDMYVYAANTSTIPQPWPASFETTYNGSNPMNITIHGETSMAYFSASPPQFCTPNRRVDHLAAIDHMNNAKASIDIMVMDYLPVTVYLRSGNFYWGMIDDAIRGSAFRGIQVRLLAAHWNYSIPEMQQYLESLNALNNVTVKIYTVPNVTNQAPYTRVNHVKFMVTDDAAFITTSNWTPDYFLFTGGISLSTTSDKIRSSVQALFDRDWDSEYSRYLDSYRTPKKL